jgi:hypothetical protein
MPSVSAIEAMVDAVASCGDGEIRERRGDGVTETA